MNQKNKKRTLNLFFYIFILFGISITAIDPLIPVISEQLNIGYDKIGIALFIGSIFTLLATIISGRLSDRFDIKKIVLYGLFLLFFGFLLFSIYLNYIIFIIVIMLLRVGFGILDTSIHSFSSKLFRDNISNVFINLDMFWFTGAVIGPLLISGTLFLDIKPTYVFLLFSFAFAASIIIFYKICPKKETKYIEPNEISAQRNVFSSIKNPIVLLTSLILFFYMGSIAGFSSWLTTYFLAFGVRVALGSAFLSLYWLFSILGLLLINKILKKTNEITLLFLGCLVGTACLSVFSFVPNIYIKIVFFSIQAIFFSGIFPLSTSIAVHESSKSSGTILGFVIAFVFSGSIVFHPVFGYVAEYLGKHFIAYVALAIALIGLIFTFILLKVYSRKYKTNAKKVQN